MSDSNATELLPCPFCGGEAEIKYAEWWDSNDPPEIHCVWSVQCSTRPTRSSVCLGRLCGNRGFADKDKAIEAWNTRYERTCENEYGLENGVPLKFKCSECKDVWAKPSVDEFNFCPTCGAKVVSA